MNDIIIIIQARSNSSRLPNKVLLPFYNDQTILDIILSKLKHNKYDIPIILATTNKKKDNKLVNCAIKHNINYYRGSEEDVLDRYYHALKTYNKKYCIRVCSDNPFLSLKYLDDLIFEAYKTNYDYDYVAYTHDNKIPTIKTHIGLFCEFVSRKAINYIYNNTTYEKDKIFREHVTNFIYNDDNKHLFNIKLLPIFIIPNFSQYRLTLDTERDFKILRHIYEYLMKNNKETGEISINKIFNTINKVFPNYVEKMKVEIMNNNK